MSIARPFVALLGHLWAAPVTVVGLCAGLPMLLAGARATAHPTHLEIAGGPLGRAWDRRCGPTGCAAITLGHLVLGVDAATLTALRPHEQVHVRQYERWGPLLPPAYALAALWQWTRGRDPYLDNPFEREARIRGRRHARTHLHRT